MPDACYNFVVCSLEDCDIILCRPSFSKFSDATSGTVTEVVPRGQAYRLPVFVETTILFVLGVHLPPFCKREHPVIEFFFHFHLHVKI
jgi:hypothetical protein